MKAQIVCRVKFDPANEQLLAGHYYVTNLNQLYIGSLKLTNVKFTLSGDNHPAVGQKVNVKGDEGQFDTNEDMLLRFNIDARKDDGCTIVLDYAIVNIKKTGV